MSAERLAVHAPPTQVLAVACNRWLGGTGLRPPQLHTGHSPQIMHSNWRFGLHYVCRRFDLLPVSKRTRRYFNIRKVDIFELGFRSRPFCKEMHCSQLICLCAPAGYVPELNCPIFLISSG